MSLLHSLGWVALVAAAVMTLGWLWQRHRENAGIVDVLWSACVGGSAILLAVLAGGLVAVLAGLLSTVGLTHRQPRAPWHRAGVALRVLLRRTAS